MLFIEHIWTLPWEQKPIIMYGWFRNQEIFDRFACYEMRKWNASIQQGETREYSEEYYKQSMGK